MQHLDGVLRPVAGWTGYTRLESEEPRPGAERATACDHSSSDAGMAPRSSDMAFLDREPDPNDVPEELLGELIRQSDLLRKKWDEMYPENPVESKEESDD